MSDAATRTHLHTQAVRTLAARMRGKLVQPADDGYDEARAVWNGVIDRRPALIAQCADVGDVIAAVDFARDNGLLLAVRGGGHSVAGNGVCDRGLVIDLAQMNRVEFDASQLRQPRLRRPGDGRLRAGPSE